MAELNLGTLNVCIEADATDAIEEIEKIIDVDSLGYLGLDNVAKIVCGNKNEGFCTACFDGLYPTEIPKETVKDKFEKKISEKEDAK